jgi:hypothetical protein
MYEKFNVFRDGGAQVGAVEAQDADEAVFRLMGGPWGRTDFYALRADFFNEPRHRRPIRKDVR